MTKLFEAKPYIICEVGSNWTNFTDAKDSIQMAKQCGADAVKFQLFDEKSLYGVPVSSTALIQDEENPRVFERREVGIPGKLPIDWLPKLADKAKAAGIEFMVTAFSPELVKAVDPFVSVHKVASSDLTCPQMLEAVKATGKPVILSCGASSEGDITLAVRGHQAITWKGFGADYPLILLYCNAAYPSRFHNLFTMEALKSYGYPVGLSDHSSDVIYAPLSAVKHFGAVVIEKHFKLRDDMQTPDAGHSLNPHEFKTMVDYIRGKAPMLAPTVEERSMFLRHNRRLIAIKDIPAGELLQFDGNFGCYRSLEDDAEGSLGFLWLDFEGKRAKVDIRAGKGISRTMVE